MDPVLGELRQVPDTFEVLATEQVVHGGDRPASGNEPPPAPTAERPGGERPLDPAHSNAVLVQLLNRYPGIGVGVARQAVEPGVDAPDVEPDLFDRRTGTVRGKVIR